MHRVHNFGAGPCTLPLEVLVEARAEFVDFAGSGMSVIELSHRSPEYEAVHRRALDLARRVSGVPDDFDVLFVQGGASLQFAMVPLNLLDPGGRAAYVVSGAWGKRAMEDAASFAPVSAAWDGGAEGYRRMPSPAEVVVEPGARYLHVTTNETIGGIRMVEWPDTAVPLVADVSSELLARPIDWPRYDVVYGGIQKNLGPAGMALVFVRRGAVRDRAPAGYLSYRWHAEHGSLANTPPMFSIYLMGKVLSRLEAAGGVAALERASAEKASRVYAAIDGSDGFYRNPVDRGCRSHMNVVFRLADEAREEAFLAEAERRGMVGLRGHRSVGGCRASLYAGLAMDAVDALVELMDDVRRAG
jgi:phosphoserine aminotransferase